MTDDPTGFLAIAEQWREDNPGKELPYFLFAEGMAILEREMRERKEDD